MPILRHNHTHNFLIIPNETVYNCALSLKDLGLLVYMLTLPDDWEFTIKGLCAALPYDGRDSISASLERIESAGYLNREQERDTAGKLRGNIWNISDLPVFLEKEQNAENPHPETGFPVTAKPATENPTQYKYLINTNTQVNNNICAKAEKPKFTPPTIEQVKLYCEERKNGIDAERFVDYYTANGWIQGKGKPIKDWKACVRTWERNSPRQENKDNTPAPRWVSTGEDEYGNPTGYWSGGEIA